MSDVKYYALKRGEDFPSEFCAVDDSDGEPGEYRYYVPDGFWDNGDTLHVELPKLPDAIMVRLPDKRDREVHSARSWRYVREGESENAKLREENDKLVKVLHEVESDAVDAYHGLQHDCKLLTGEIDDRFMKYWHEQCENAKLRELCADVWHLFTEHGAVHPCDLPVVDAVRDRMRDLGVEVD